MSAIVVASHTACRQQVTRAVADALCAHNKLISLITHAGYGVRYRSPSKSNSCIEMYQRLHSARARFATGRAYSVTSAGETWLGFRGAPSESMARDVMELLRDVPLSQPLTPTPTTGAASRGGVPPTASPCCSSSPADRSRRLDRLQWGKGQSCFWVWILKAVRPSYDEETHAGRPDADAAPHSELQSYCAGVAAGGTIDDQIQHAPKHSVPERPAKLIYGKASRRNPEHQTIFPLAAP